MILLIILSIGAIYAFIPIIIILILIVASRSAAGFGDFFQLFGLNTLLGFRGANTGGAGKGISNRTAYRSSKSAVSAGGRTGPEIFKFEHLKPKINNRPEKPAFFGMYRKYSKDDPKGKYKKGDYMLLPYSGDRIPVIPIRTSGKPVGIRGTKGEIWERFKMSSAKDASQKQQLLDSLSGAELNAMAITLGLTGVSKLGKFGKINAISKVTDKKQIKSYLTSLGGPGRAGAPPPLPAPTAGRVKLSTALKNVPSSLKNEAKKGYTETKQYYRTRVNPQYAGGIKALTSPTMEMAGKMTDSQLKALLTKYKTTNKITEFDPARTYTTAQMTAMVAQKVKKEDIWVFLGLD